MEFQYLPLIVGVFRDIMLALGGTAVVVLALSKWLGNVWANRWKLEYIIVESAFRAH